MLKDAKNIPSVCGDDEEFDHLHVHTFYSLLDACSSPKELATRAKELGMKALAITDHGHLAGVVDFQKACKEVGIKPIIGVELYYTENMEILSSAEKQKELAEEAAEKAGFDLSKCKTKKEAKAIRDNFSYDKKSRHILFIAKNRRGYLNLVKLQSEAARLCTTKVFDQPHYHCDDNLISLYCEDLIMTTACIGSYPAHLIDIGKDEEAEQCILKWHKMLKDDFYLEIQPYNSPLQYKVNCFYIQMSNKHNIPIVATNDVHYALKEDNDDHDTALCVGIRALKDDPNRIRYNHEFWMRSREEMEEAFCSQYKTQKNKLGLSENEYLEYCYQALSQTSKIAEQVEDNILLGSEESLLPKVKLDTCLSPEDYLSLTCYRNLFAYKKKKPKINLNVYIERLAYELSVINPKGFASYMLINWENIKWCEENGIATGPGRGSAAGSLVLFLLNVTKVIDPIEHGLLFFRFLTVDRTSLPDVDADYSYKRRGEVIKHLQDTYGYYNIAHIGTITRLGVKSGIKDFARVLGYNPTESDAICKQIDIITEAEPGVTFKDIDKLKDSKLPYDQKRYTMFAELEKQHEEVFRLSRKFQNMPRNMGVHASGILITPKPVSDIFPIKYEDGVQVCLFDGKILDKFNALKLDVLGLRTLDIINDYVVHKDNTKNIYYLYDIIGKKLSNQNYFKDIKALKTEAIFQLESDLFKGIIKDMQPENIDDITALVALGRPGPLDAGMHTMYNNRKKGLEVWDEPLPFTMEFVENTYGCVIYQEQIMQIAQKVAKFNGNQTDSMFRKAVAKKDPELFEVCRRCFIWGKVNKTPPKDYDENNLNQVYYDPEGKYGDAIPGGIHNTDNGDCYTEEMLMNFLEQMKKYSSYLFNKSHAACYALLACLTAYCAHEDRASYFAQVLEMDAQKDGKKIDRYINVCNLNGIQVLPPDINYSNLSFTEYEGNIYFGLSGIKKVGKAAKLIIDNRPYNSISDLLDRTNKKEVNKSVVENLIKAGAFDRIHSNRYHLLNEVHTIRKDKKEEILDESKYDKEACRKFELDTMKTVITYPSIWKSVQYNSEVTANCLIEKLTIKNDKRGREMGFLELSVDGMVVKGIIFASNYKKIKSKLEEKMTVALAGKVDDKGTFIINGIGKNAQCINAIEIPKLAYRFADSF